MHDKVDEDGFNLFSVEAISVHSQPNSLILNVINQR